MDVVWYGGPYGAYTSLNPIHVTISSHDARNQDIYGFEVLFHESSHALAGGVTQAIAAACDGLDIGAVFILADTLHHAALLESRRQAKGRRRIQTRARDHITKAKNFALMVKRQQDIARPCHGFDQVNVTRLFHFVKLSLRCIHNNS